jgi:N-formylglutamate deformylase
MSLSPYRILRRGYGPIVAASLHDGHDTRDDLDALFGIDSAARLREEDPSTSVWTQVADTQFVALRSRFEVDLNRPREKAVYQTPEDAWQLEVWREAIATDAVEQSLAVYDQFYADVERVLRELLTKHTHLVVYDLHTYNHLRDGTPASEEENPEVNIGTGSMDREYWGPVADQFIGDLSAQQIIGRTMDVRENVKFFGGNFPQWIHRTFPGQVCAIAIEFKKVFMDERTGEIDLDHVAAIYRALEATVPGVERELRTMDLNRR